MTDSTTPQDSAAMPPASAGSVAELVETIAAFMDQTDRFKDGAVPVVTPEATKARMAFFRLRKLLDAAPSQHTLTDAEQEAIQEVIDYLQPAGQRYPNHVAATLRSLLERLG